MFPILMVIKARINFDVYSFVNLLLKYVLRYFLNGTAIFYQN